MHSTIASLSVLVSEQSKFPYWSEIIIMHFWSLIMVDELLASINAGMVMIFGDVCHSTHYSFDVSMSMIKIL